MNQYGLKAQFRCTPYGQWQAASWGWSTGSDLDVDPNDPTVNVFNVHELSVG